MVCDKYREILDATEEEVDRLELVRGDPCRRGRRLHRTYIEAQLAEVEAILVLLDAADTSP